VDRRFGDARGSVPKRKSDRSYEVVLGSPSKEGLAKVPGLQGPIDDAFMDRFLMVRPTGAPFNPTLGEWTQKEMTHAIDHWRKQFRGDAPVKDDKDVTAGDIADANLVLWGDPQSNKVLAQLVGK